MATKGATKEKTKNHLQEPKRYHVVMYNDDFTTMEFVVEVLVTIFRKSEVEAQRLMLQVHHSGKSVVGTYSYDIAMTKVNACMVRANEEGFPFTVEVQEA